MSLRHAILVLLEDQEASGYDLAREFANSVGLVWNATHQQIYLELGKLNSRQMVSFRHMPQAGKPDKKLYSITEAGHQELVQWLHRPAGPARVRESFMVKIAGGALADTRDLLKELESISVERRERLASFEMLARKLDESGRDRDIYGYLTLRRGILDQRAWLQWAEEVRVALEARLAQSNGAS